ncbi:para-nitrobenzyl esterase [Nannizzia gypsea CBS 118893]|uniref:Carboxylic ester hydrolase n=1 Tax=Arthroderma gypseum (strain ATCC MYA-4604 / CBS 118893) TaxID=535722 RepID=E4UW54_ARTGP|nr:para-nitrobenzyl esterase [Nannizzia gypsea CBS 118893]EFR01662.1 para-nitrobenzyl esterase [Nannizzia gypsea CBS 118893]
MRFFLETLAFCAVLIPATTASPLERLRSYDKVHASPVVTIDSGVIIGKNAEVLGSKATVHQFLGIPFAKPPVKDLRFSPPERPLPWDKPRRTTKSPPACIQDFGNKTSGSEFQKALFNTPPAPGESEDCLYLNVYRPSGDYDGKPILFWIYGGGYRFGASSYPFYDGSSLAANQDIIVVTVNYRTNLFGFPRSPQLPLDQRNLGILDQRLALDWVKRNIHAFGGDPDKVTIAGQSAGAVSVGHLINTAPADLPFRAAILQSGSSLFQIPPSPPNSEFSSWTALVQRLNCTVASDSAILECVRGASADTLRGILLETGLPFQKPNIDNVTVLESPAKAYAAGQAAKVPILIGSTLDDGSTFAYGKGDNVTAFIGSLSFPPGVAEAITKLYAPNSTATTGLSTGNQIISQMITDSTFRCPAGFTANLTTTALKARVWQYLFNDPAARHPEYPDLGVYHTSDIAYVFGTQGLRDPGQANKLWLQKLWADFVKDPQAGPGWRQYPSVGLLMGDGTNAIPTKDVKTLDPICREWDRLYSLALLKR